MKQLIPLATGFVTLYGLWLAGNKRWQGWLVGLLNQILWFIFIVAFDAWGLLPLCIALTVMYCRNLLRWRREAIEASENGDTVTVAVAGGRSGAPRDFPRESQEAMKRAMLYDWSTDSKATLPRSRVSSVGNLMGLPGELVRLSGRDRYYPVVSVCRDSRGLVNLTVAVPWQKSAVTFVMRADEPCRIVQVAA